MKAEMTAAAALLSTRIGFETDGTSARRIASAISDGAALVGATPTDYVARLATDADAFQQFVDLVTVQETAFFRHPEQFALLRRSLLAELPQPALIWSAACSNGQEAYTLAILLEELGLPGTVLASDISTRALARTRAARYEERELTGLSEERRSRFLTPVDGAYEFVPAIRDRVRVRRHNLAADIPPFDPGRCNLVLCRNVLIYFSAAETVAFLRKLHQHLPEGAHLMVGGSESLLHVEEVFTTERRGRVYLYRRTELSGRSRPPREARPTLVRPATPQTVSTPRGAPSPRVPSLSAPAVAAPPARTPARAATPPVHPPVEDPATDLPAMRQEASAAAERGDWAAAATAYRAILYLTPDDVSAAVGLGLVLEAGGDQGGAGRAFRVARRALSDRSLQELEQQFDGYRLGDLAVLLEEKLKEAA